MLRSLLCIGLLACSSLTAAADNWPQFLGPTGDGHSDATGLPTTWSEKDNVRWKTPIHDRGWSSPVIWGDQVWLTTATENGKQMSALCLNGETGKIVHDLKLFENEQVDEIHTLNSYASPTPAIEEGRVYIHFGSYGTACLDTKTGKTLWQRRDLPCKHHRGPGSSPVLFENTVILTFDGFDHQYVVALDKKTGENVWKTPREVDYGTKDGDIMKAFATPLLIDVAGQKQLISPCSKAALAYDPRTGKEIWRVRHSGFSSTAKPVFGHGMVFINTGFGKADLYAVKIAERGDVTDTNIAWKATKQIGSKPTSLLVDDWIFGVHDSGVATCINAKTGAEVWQKRLGGNFSSSPIVAAGNIYFCSQEGMTHVVKAAGTFEEVAANKLDDGFMASPAVSGKSLFLRTRTHLYRIEN